MTLEEPNLAARIAEEQTPDTSKLAVRVAYPFGPNISAWLKEHIPSVDRAWVQVQHRDRTAAEARRHATGERLRSEAA